VLNIQTKEKMKKILNNKTMEKIKK